MICSLYNVHIFVFVFADNFTSKQFLVILLLFLHYNYQVSFSLDVRPDYCTTLSGFEIFVSNIFFSFGQKYKLNSRPHLISDITKIIGLTTIRKKSINQYTYIL